jgi:hypothetical protein
MEISVFWEVTPCSLADNKHTEIMEAAGLPKRYLPNYKPSHPTQEQFEEAVL